MAITERTERGMRTVLPDGQIQVRTDTVIERDGVEIARTYHRRVLAPGDNVANESDEIKRLTAVEWTDRVVAAYKARVALTP